MFKMRKLSLILLPFITFSLFGCSDTKSNQQTSVVIGENGNWFINGEDTGIKAEGQKGQDGSAVLTGEGKPNNNVGHNGDSYIDLSTWDYYIKDNDVWSLKGNIKGQTNEQGLQFFLTDDNTYYVAQGSSTLLSNIVIPSTYNDFPVVGILNYGFDGSNMKNITIPDSVTVIGDFAFSSCENLESIIFSKNITSIGDNAFDCCSSLKEIDLPEKVTSIGDAAFYDCFSLKTVSIPDSLTSIGTNVFYGCRSLEFNEHDNGYYLGNKTNPHFLLVKTSKELTSFSIANGCKIINSGAFENGSTITTLNISETVAYIFENFKNFDVLNEINVNENNINFFLDNHILYSGDKKLLFCPRSTSGEVIIPDGVTAIGDYAFSGCVSMTSVKISDSVTIVGDYSFYRCRSLLFIIIPNNVLSIGDYAFAECNCISVVDIGDGVQTIGTYAFYESNSYAFFVIPKSVEYIGYGAFNMRSSWLPTIFYGGTENQWDKYNARSGDNIYFESDTTFLTPVINDKLFYAVSNKNEVYMFTIYDKTIDSFDFANEFPGLTVVSIGFFSGCASLQSIVIPNSVTYLYNGAFYECASLQSIVIPNSVTDLGYNTFNYCSSLTFIYFEGTAEQWGDRYYSSDYYNISSKIYFYSETAPTEDGNYWHYVDNVPTVW